MVSKNPKARIPLSTILIDKWLKSNYFSSTSKSIIFSPSPSPTRERAREATEKTFSKEELSEIKLIGTNTPGKIPSLSTNFISTNKISCPTPPTQHKNFEQNNKIINSVNSIFINSETSLLGSQASCSNISKESSFESFTKRSNFNMSEKLIPINSSSDEINTIKNSYKINKNQTIIWMISGTDRILTHTRTVIQSQNSNMIQWSNGCLNSEENVMICDEKPELKKLMKYLIANGVKPKFNKSYN